MQQKYCFPDVSVSANWGPKWMSILKFNGAKFLISISNWIWQDVCRSLTICSVCRWFQPALLERRQLAWCVSRHLRDREIETERWCLWSGADADVAACLSRRHMEWQRHPRHSHLSDGQRMRVPDTSFLSTRRHACAAESPFFFILILACWLTTFWTIHRSAQLL